MQSACPGCGNATELVRLIELPADASAESTTLSTRRCPECDLRCLGLYTEPHGSVLGDGRWRFDVIECGAAAWDALEELLAKCYDPRWIECTCPAHQRLAVYDRCGRWVGLELFVERWQDQPDGASRVGAAGLATSDDRSSDASAQRRTASGVERKSKEATVWWHPVARALRALMETATEWVARPAHLSERVEYRDATLCANLTDGEAALRSAVGHVLSECDAAQAAIRGDEIDHADAAGEALRATARAAVAVLDIAEVEREYTHGPVPFSTLPVLSAASVRDRASFAAERFRSVSRSWEEAAIDSLRNATHAAGAAFDALAELDGDEAQTRMEKATLWFAMARSPD